MPGAGEHGAAAAHNRLGRGLPPCRGSDGSFDAYRSTALAETFSGSDVPKLQIDGARRVPMRDARGGGARTALADSSFRGFGCALIIIFA